MHTNNVNMKIKMLAPEKTLLGENCWLWWKWYHNQKTVVKIIIIKIKKNYKISLSIKMIKTKTEIKMY